MKMETKNIKKYYMNIYLFYIGSDVDFFISAENKLLRLIWG